MAKAPAVPKAPKEPKAQAVPKAPKEPKAQAVPKDTPAEEAASGLRRVVLEGSSVHGAINGVEFTLPGGVEIEIPEDIYHAVKAHIAQER